MIEEHMQAPTGAYAVDALPDDEREAFERHLLDCPACVQEVRELTATAARLATAVAAGPPPEMKKQVITWIQNVRQLPPHVPFADATHRVESARGRHLPRLILAACVAAATLLAGGAAWQFQEAQQAEQRAQQVSAKAADMTRVLTASDARSATGSVKGGARATVIVSRSHNSAVFLASGLPELPHDKTYQLWFDDGGTMRAAGLVGHDGGRMMTGDIGAATGIGVTVEPVDGSLEPSTTPLTLIALPA
ncbi:anti-sigma factor [Streptomyces sp. H27-C3]|uniref:anti-sigma factor n=1 Tax=Streptomyces sp. H27-C3 TaxID=3046305 RepID=UPI0024BA5A03|nr:anti-sigma factor [Streptomyces sp. H27-C3]MDJ0464003.1 anti-sigma factor [Streptomyces sp. H27-C3]